MQIQSIKHLIARKPAEVYFFIQDFRNLGVIMPDQVNNYRAGADECSFEISGMGEVFLVVKERIENQRVSAVSAGNTSIQFELRVELEPENENSTSAIIYLHADISPMLAMIAKTPLNNFIDIMAARLRDVLVL